MWMDMIHFITLKDVYFLNIYYFLPYFTCIVSNFSLSHSAGLSVPLFYVMLCFTFLQQMKLLLFLMVMGTVSAEIQDLSGKVFTFPRETDTAHVRLNPIKQDYNAVTVCHRSFTDLKRDHTFFSLATPFDTSAFLILWQNQEIDPHVKSERVEYGGWDYKPNMWHSICTTWDSVTGLVQIWFDGLPSIRRFIISGSITGTVKAILGQDQDTHGGGFDIHQSFVGMLTDVHIWDYTLSPCEIRHYTEEMHFTTGNVLNWSALDFEIIDNVLIENRFQICH
ncbi:C-reactive protein isoform X1 [Oryzias latipes]|uniref:Pentraxin (PTX) domain-containing protein n=2 Tax=Oryzias latipes TaxID=8090 RepID=A0A3B3I0M9_ORYLA|nr:C-reactive protein isoform X1 [Oryzias latipes]